MPRGNPAVKLAISVDADVARRVAEAAADEDLSVSAWMTEAARGALRIRDGLAAVRAWEREHGAFTEAELEAARAEVQRKHRATKRPRRAR